MAFMGFEVVGGKLSKIAENVKPKSITEAYNQGLGIANGNKTTENIIAKIEQSVDGGALQEDVSEAVNRATDYIDSGQFNDVIDNVANKIHNVVGDSASKLKSAIAENVNEVRKNLVGSGQADSSKTVDNFVSSRQPDNSEQINNQQTKTIENFTNNPKYSELPKIQSNVLENFVSANYVLSLGCLTNKELADPDGTYLKKGEPSVMVIKSGGGNHGLGEKKIKTSMERASGTDPGSAGPPIEFFIEDLEMRAPIAPNPKSRAVNQHLLSFKIIEPYSMGQWMEALALAAYSAGHQNYVGAPFVLMIDWVGYLENGQIARLGDFAFQHSVQTRRNPHQGDNSQYHHRKRFIPIKLAATSMRVTGGGSEYDCQAYPYNEGAQMKSIVSLPGDYELEGETVAELLQTGVNSLTTNINNTLLERDADNKFKFADEYVILFPTERASADFSDSGITGDAGATVGTFKTREEILKQVGDHELDPHGTELQKVLDENTFDFETWTKKILGVSVTRNKTHEKYKDSLQAERNINQIGKSKVQFSFLQAGNTKNLPDGFVYDEKKEVYTLRNMVIPKNGRVFRFTKGTSILNIIEEVVIQSDFGKRLRERAISKQGTKTWFRIETQVFNIPVYEVEATKGAFPKLYVYKVVEYEKHTGVWTKATETARGIKELKKKVIKNYDYIYTGSNKDIIDFDIQFNYRFLTGVSGDVGSTTKDRQNPGQFANTAEGKLITERQKLREGEYQKLLEDKSGPAHLSHNAPEKQEEKLKEGWKSVREMNLINISKSGLRAVPSGEADEVARLFNEAVINHSADMMVLKLTIWGDPYFISDSGMGNYSSKGSFEEFIDGNGMMQYQYKEVMINVNFRTGFDFDENGVMRFPTVGGKKLDHFSGIYRVVLINNSFSNGKFQQELDLIRIRHQTDEPDSTDPSPVEANPHVDGKKKESTGTDTNKQSAAQEIKGAFFAGAGIGQPGKEGDNKTPTTTNNAARRVEGESVQQMLERRQKTLGR